MRRTLTQRRPRKSTISRDSGGQEARRPGLPREVIFEKGRVRDSGIIVETHTVVGPVAALA